MSLKFINNVSVLLELAVEPGSPVVKVCWGRGGRWGSAQHPPLFLPQVSMRTRIPDVLGGTEAALEAILQSATSSDA